MKKKTDETIEHRGNNYDVAGRLLLEMELIKNINQEEPVYSFENKEKPGKKNKH